MCWCRLRSPCCSYNIDLVDSQQRHTKDTVRREKSTSKHLKREIRENIREKGKDRKKESKKRGWAREEFKWMAYCFGFQTRHNRQEGNWLLSQTYYVKGQIICLHISKYRQNTTLNAVTQILNYFRSHSTSSNSVTENCINFIPLFKQTWSHCNPPSSEHPASSRAVPLQTTCLLCKPMSLNINSL